MTGGDLLMANALEYVANVGYLRPYGAGCAGSLGVPTLASAGGSRPALGTTFNAVLGNLPLNVAIVVAGFSDTVYGPFTLPLDLTPFGLPGCNLLASPGVSQFLVGSGNSATWSLTLPNSAVFLGALLFNQGFALDTPANPAGLTVSNGGRIRVGT